MQPLHPWQNFYVIIGSAAGGLTGLQFVAMALIADIDLGPNESDANNAFATPTLVYFVTAFLLAATMVMPWQGIAHVALAWTVLGVLGAGYSVFVANNMRRTTYKPILEDWCMRAIVPFAIYVALAIAGILARTEIHLHDALFFMAAVALALLVLGIQHAWDNVTYLAFVKRRGKTQ